MSHWPQYTDTHPTLQVSRLEAAGARGPESVVGGGPTATPGGPTQPGGSGVGAAAHMPSNLLKMLRPLPTARPLFLAAPGVANAQVSMALQFN